MTTLVDATLVLRWGPQIPTGIPRVETGIVRGVIERNGDDARLFCFDSSEKRFRLLRDNESEFVRRSLGAEGRFMPSAAQGLSLRARVREITSLYALNPSGARESHRLIAQYLVAAPERSGFRYQIAKALVRARFAWARDQLRAVNRSANRQASDAFLSEPENGWLVSLNTAYISEKFNGANNLAGKITLIVYDTIALDYPEFTVVDPDRFKSAFRRFVAAASTIVCISRATADSVREWSRRLGIDLTGKTVRSIRIPSSLHAGGSEAAQVPELVGRKFVAYCSTIEPRKNHKLLLRVWSSLAREIGVENLPTLALIGRWGWKYEPVEKMLRDDDMLRKSVRLFSYLPDRQLIWVYANAQYTVFPSIAEGWGLGAAESLEFGTPVVIADSAALREATGDLMPAIGYDDERGWKSTIRQLALDPSKLAALRKIVREKYTSQPSGEDWDDVLNAMSGGSSKFAVPSPAGTNA